MAPATADLTIYRGDDYAALVIVRVNGEAEDQTGATWLAQLRTRASCDDIVATFTVDDAGAGDGEIVLRLTAEQTAALPRQAVYDVQRTLDGVVITVLAGQATLTEDVSR